jgi:hypothetical protein
MSQHSKGVTAMQFHDPSRQQSRTPDARAPEPERLANPSVVAGTPSPGSTVWARIVQHRRRARLQKRAFENLLAAYS